MNSKHKGNVGENELLGILLNSGLDAHRNDQRYVSGFERPDIAFSAKGVDYHVECKRTERLSLYEAYKQAVRDANGKALPVVIHRRSRKPWLVILSLNDWLKILGGKDLIS